MFRTVSLLRRNVIYRFISTGLTKCDSHSSPRNEEPVKFSVSKASEWKAAYSRSGVEGEEESAWFQPYVVIGSVATFLLYFCVLREENDIDQQLGASLYDKIEGLEEAQLRRVLAFNLENGNETRDISARLKQLEDMRKRKSDN